MRSRRTAGAFALVLSAALLAGGCTTAFGAKTIPKSRASYNESLIRSANQQVLLNLVRLRYRDTPLFLDVNTIVASYEWQGGASASATLNESAADSAGLGTGLSYSESPTITYSPLRGQDFVQRLLSPITPEVIALLSQSGWSVDRLLRCCVHRVNSLENAPSAAGPTPDESPRYQDFHRLAALLRSLQVQDLLDLEPGIATARADDAEIRLKPPGAGSRNQELTRAGQEVRELLGLPAGDSAKGETLELQGRSLLAVFFYLSQAVEPPADHARRGLVTATRNPDGSAFSWDEMMDGLFWVHSGDKAPENAFVAVPYRGAWFWIADDDLTSKSTFNLLTFLLALQSTKTEDNLLLTVGAGG